TTRVIIANRAVSIPAIWELNGSRQLDKMPEASLVRENSIAPTDSLQAGGAGSTRALRHLFGPVFLVAGISAIAMLGAYLSNHGIPHRATDHIQTLPRASSPETIRVLERLLDYQLKDYKTNVDKFNANLQLQAVVIIVTILLIIRQSDSLNFLDNSIPLSWLHFFVPVVLIYLWLGFGFTLGDLIWSRIRSIELITALNR